jgi:hypothetical protein
LPAGRENRSNSLISSHTSLDEENFFKHAPDSTSFPRHSQESYSALNSSNSSWNEEIF